MPSTQQCARCKAAFECKAEDIANCACSTVQLNPKAIKHLKEAKYEGCLCKACLVSINNEESNYSC